VGNSRNAPWTRCAALDAGGWLAPRSPGAGVRVRSAGAPPPGREAAARDEAGQQTVRPSTRRALARAECQLYRDHPDAQFAYEQLHVAGMRFKARRMNAYLYASDLAHIPAQLAWGAVRRGIRARTVKSAYRSQECQCCHYAARENRPSQQTLRCVVCGHTKHADVYGAENLASRLFDHELAACADRKFMKVLLARRHRDWQDQQRMPVVHPPA